MKILPMHINTANISIFRYLQFVVVACLRIRFEYGIAGQGGGYV